MWKRLERKLASRPNVNTTRKMRVESLENRRLMAADAIHVGVVYLETDYLESDQDVGSDSRGDRFLLSFTGGAPGTELRELTIRTDKDGDGISVGDPIFDTAVGGRGKNGAHPFRVQSIQTVDGSPADVTATVEDGGQALTLNFRGFSAGDRLEFTIDVDEVLRDLPDLEQFNQRLDVITSGQEFQDSILKALFEAPNHYAAEADAVFWNDFGDPAAEFGLNLPADEGTDIDSRPNRSAAAVGTAVQTPIPASLSGFVYRDDNDSGSKDPGEVGLGGVPIRLIPVDTIAPQSELQTTTEPDGSYRFNDLMPGRYRVVEVEQPADLEDGLDSAGTINGRVVGSALNPGDEIRDIVLGGGDAGVDYNFGEVPLGSIGGFVYLAAPGADCDGDHDATDSTPLRNVELRLIGRNGETIATTRTAADGSYRFHDLRTGVYDVVEITPDGLFDGSSHSGVMRTIASSLFVSVGSSVDGGRIEDVVLPPGGEGNEYNFCEAAPGSLSGHVYHDRDNDGVRESGEEAIANVELSLVNSTGAVVETTRTDASGAYLFAQLAADTYRIVETQPPGYVDGIDSVGQINGTTVGGRGSDSDSLVGIALRQGLQGVNYDFGERQFASLGGRVHVDLDEDCVMDAGESPLAGVMITLVDSAGNQVAETVTGSDGRYLFANLLPGSYTVIQTQPEGYFEGSSTPGSAGGIRETASRIGSITLGSGEVAVDYDFCERPPAEISGVVYVDRNADCFRDDGEEGLSGVMVELLDESGNLIASTRTDASGVYRFSNLPAGFYTVRETQPTGYFHGGQRAGSNGGDDSVADLISFIDVGWGEVLTQYNFCELLPSELSGVVYVDRDADCVQDSDEVGLAGVTVELFNENGQLVQTTTTGADGSYRFGNLSAGMYTVHETQPDGYFQGGQVAGSGGGDASVTDVISSVPVGWGETLTRYDFCELLPSSISGTVWSDPNVNQTFDDGELLLSDVTIELRDASNQTIATTQTNANGFYQFDQLAPGTYSVFEVQPAGYFQGSQLIGNFGGSIFGSLDGPFFPIDTIGNIVLPGGVQAIEYDFTELPPATISGYVFQDGEDLILKEAPQPEQLRQFRDGLRTSDDTALAGVTLEIRNTLGQRLASETETLAGSYETETIYITTDVNGFYQFTGLRPNRLYSIYQIQPAGFIDSLDTPGTSGGQSVNLADFVDTDSESVTIDFPAGIRSLMSDPATDPKFDAILQVFASSGQISADNNFSEIAITPPPEFPQEEPPQPTLVNRPIAPIETFAAAIRPIAFGIDLDNRRTFQFDDEWAVSWHLSVINGGFPRGGEGVDSAIVQTNDFTDEDGTVRRVAFRSEFSEETQKASMGKLADSLLRHDLMSGQWQIRSSKIDTLSARFANTPRIVMGHPDATPLTGDFDGDGADEAVLFLGGQWFVDLNGNGLWDAGDLWVRLGTEMDRPVVGDWDGDGKDDVGIFGRRWENDARRIKRDPGLPDPANTRRRHMSREELVHDEGTESEQRQRLLMRGEDGGLLADAVDHVFQYGEQVDTPIAGDWNGDGIDQIGVFRAGQWLLDEDADGRWTGKTKADTFGRAGDEPIVGDFDGDGIDEIGVVRDNVWIIDSDGDRRLTANDQRIVVPRESGDSIPIVGDFDGDDCDDPGYYRSAG